MHHPAPKAIQISSSRGICLRSLGKRPLSIFPGVPDFAVLFRHGANHTAGITHGHYIGGGVLPPPPAPAAPARKKAANFAAGDLVDHKVFGRGKVLKVTPVAGDCIVEIQFDRVGIKKTMANYAPLTKLTSEE